MDGEWWLTRTAFQVDILEREAFEVLRLIRSMKNRVAPINRIPPEVLILLPDSWGTDCKRKGIIALTHVCQTWREIFISRSSLWTDFDCMDIDKTQIYLERSKSSPINVLLKRTPNLLPYDLFFWILPHTIGRLKSLSINGNPSNIRDITARLSFPAPLLEDLSICGGSDFFPLRNPTLTSTLFNGDLSSLRTLYLQCVRTELPWRNMDNLTSFTLCDTSPGNITVMHLLDFFENAPRLCKIRLYTIRLHTVTPASDAQNGRLVSLTRLKRMCIIDSGPSSLLLDHLLIPVGASLTTQVVLRGPLIEDHLPRSLDNLRNLSGFTKIRLFTVGWPPRVELSGPNGQVTMAPISQTDTSCMVLESLVQFGVSKVRRLEINYDETLSRDLVYRMLLATEDLCTLVLSHCYNPHGFIAALCPNINSPEVVACPKLEELILTFSINGGTFNLKDVIGMGAARALGGSRLRTVRIVDGQDALDPGDVLELKKHVMHVEYGPKVDEVGGYNFSDDDDEED